MVLLVSSKFGAHLVQNRRSPILHAPPREAQSFSLSGGGPPHQQGAPLAPFQVRGVSEAGGITGIILARRAPCDVAWCACGGHIDAVAAGIHLNRSHKEAAATATDSDSPAPSTDSKLPLMLPAYPLTRSLFNRDPGCLFTLFAGASTGRPCAKLSLPRYEGPKGIRAALKYGMPPYDIREMRWMSVIKGVSAPGGGPPRCARIFATSSRPDSRQPGLLT